MESRNEFSLADAQDGLWMGMGYYGNQKRNPRLPDDPRTGAAPLDMLVVKKAD